MVITYQTLQVATGNVVDDHVSRCQVLGGRVDGDTVKLEIEPAKGGDKEELEADVVLVSAGRASLRC